MGNKLLIGMIVILVLFIGGVIWGAYYFNTQKQEYLNELYLYCNESYDYCNESVTVSLGLMITADVKEFLEFNNLNYTREVDDETLGLYVKCCEALNLSCMFDYLMYGVENNTRVAVLIKNNDTSNRVIDLLSKDNETIIWLFNNYVYDLNKTYRYEVYNG